MLKNIALASIALSLNVSANNTLTEAQLLLKNAPKEIKDIMNSAPSTYSFTSTFARNNNSSVSYTGQSFRQVLMNDIKLYMTTLKRGGHEAETTLDALNSFYAYNENTDDYEDGIINGDSSHKIKAKDLDGDRVLVAQEYYSDIQSPGKNLNGKLAGNDNALRRGSLKGWSSNKVGNIDLKALANGETVLPKHLVEGLFKAAAELSENGETFTIKNGNLGSQKVPYAYITNDGVDLAQVAQKFFHGAVSYSQAARDYLSTDLGPKKGLNADNTKPAKAGKAYTAMEHHFDEAFGYFGGSRDFLNYTDVEVASKLSIDTNNNGEIDLKSEKSLGLSTNFSRMDLIAKNGGFEMDLSGNTMKSFLAGRNLISKKPANYKKYVVAQGHVALANWEKALAAVTLHYVNSTIAQMDAYGTSSYLFKNHVKYWGEMKGFALSFQFSPVSIMSDTQFDRLHALMGDKPALHRDGLSGVAAYKKNLQSVAALLAEVYDFPANSTNW